MSNKGVGIAFKLTALVLLLGILGVSIGILIVTLNVRDDVEATPAVPSTTTTTTVIPSTTTTKKPVDPANPTDDKNIPNGKVIPNTDKRFGKFQEISDLYESWMDTNVDPCNDFYHYVCGKGQKSNLPSPFTISGRTDNDVEARMWKPSDDYFANSALPVQQLKWFRDKCHEDKSYTVADQEAKIKEMLTQFKDYTATPVPWFTPDAQFAMDKTALSQLIGYAKGQFGSYDLLTAYVSVDMEHPDDGSLFNIDEPLPIFVADVYTDAAYPVKKNQLVREVSDSVKEAARILGLGPLDDAKVKQMAGDVVDFDRVISRTMQQDATTRRNTLRNYNPYNLTDLNTRADQFDWVAFIKSATTLVADRANVDDTWTVIIWEEDITLNKLNAHIRDSDKKTVANYIFFRTFDQIMGSVPGPRVPKVIPTPKSEIRAVFKRSQQTITDMLRKQPETRDKTFDNTKACGKLIENLLPWAATRMYVDTDHPDLNERKAIKDNVAEIANWIFFGFRSQLDQLNWMDSDSKKGAFDKLDNIQLNVAYPDWVTDDLQLAAYYKDLDITEQDNFMNQVLKLSHYYKMQEMLPLVQKVPRDRGDFGSFIGITNAWYQPQMNSITFPEGILQEPFFNPNYPLATVFGGLGSISGHELTHGFDDQGVQWDGIGALKEWMTENSQTSFNAMAQCVIDEYSSFCPYPGVCVNGENTQGENIADNGGIQAAYKALKAYESLNGADPRLPGFGSSFTSDQLFFLTFAQTWCDQDQNEASFKSQIASDPHSPAIYRVLGTIQNFPAFKNAFNCPANTPYTPDKHCNVWTSKPF